MKSIHKVQRVTTKAFLFLLSHSSARLHGITFLIISALTDSIFTHIKVQVNPSRYFQLGFGCCCDKISSFEKVPGFRMVPIKIKEISLGSLLLSHKKWAVWYDLRQRLLRHWWRHWLTNIDLNPECSPWSSNCEVGLHHPCYFLTRAWETFPPVASDLKCLLL